MKHKSKKQDGFTLIELIISMAVVTILLASVYNGYRLMIKGTKDGQVKQTSTLIGNRVSEQIKAVAENKIFVTNGTSVDLANNISLTKAGSVDGRSIYESSDNQKLHFDENGELVSNANVNYRYIANVRLEPKTTTGGQAVFIEEVIGKTTPDGFENRNIYIVKPENSSSKISDDEDESENSGEITQNGTIKINISKSYDISMESSEFGNLVPTDNHIDKNKKQEITIDFKYCTGNIKIEVTNETKVPLNLFILNGKNVEIENEKGTLHEYRRSELGSKMGTLYNVTLQIYDRKSDSENNPKLIFETSFVQNINIK